MDEWNAQRSLTAYRIKTERGCQGDQDGRSRFSAKLSMSLNTRVDSFDLVARRDLHFPLSPFLPGFLLLRDRKAILDLHFITITSSLSYFFPSRLVVFRYSCRIQIKIFLLIILFKDYNVWLICQIEWQLGSLHTTKLCPLNVGDHWRAWVVCGTTSRGTSIFP